jgi:Dyp-type peroxidase family
MSDVEPLLELDDIQGIVLPGFLKPHQALVCVRLPGPLKKRVAVRQWLANMQAVGGFTSGRKALDDRLEVRPDNAAGLEQRRAHRRRILKNLQGGAGAVREPLVAIGFTAAGLKRLSVESSRRLAEIPGTAFHLGLARRSGLLGDYRDGNDAGHPSKWVVGAPGSEPDLMIVIAGDEDALARVQYLAQGTVTALTTLGAGVQVQWGNARADLPGFEHFGFKDGVSQPGIRGYASKGPDCYLTERHLPLGDPEREFFGYPGQHLVWPGEFVHGYLASSPDPLIPGPPRAAPAWMRNSSFLVYRRLRQDVALFNQVMEGEAIRLRQLAGFENMSTAMLKAKVIGRWPSGAPISRCPLGDDPRLGQDPLANNDFRFDDDTPVRSFAHGPARALPPAKGDIVGALCPVASHIRKVNVRDQASDIGGASATQTRRILRVGVPFGTPLPTHGPDPLRGDRGMQFLSIQASIEDQFEFLQARWINNAARPRGPGGHDMLAGQKAAAPKGVRKSRLFGHDLQEGEVSTTAQFVTATGGGYFFVPSLSTLKKFLA